MRALAGRVVHPGFFSTRAGPKGGLEEALGCNTSHTSWEKPFVTSITTQVNPLSLDELYGHLLAHEQRLEQQQSAAKLSFSTANIATRNTTNRGGCGSSGRGSSSNQNG
ncbi:hypothetical protein SO802_010101 [Lithocarpus litseifolius]|uniref:Uncharacterized protein n=1 Tax=Lithocarpus litseifolius TaxID=425828 RepID=A0AAW2DER3_9ROSI